jgi:hypothetical protein
MSFRSYWALYRMSHCHLRIAHAHCLQFERSGMVLMSHNRETSKVTVNSSYFHPAHQHYTDEAHKAETVPSVVRYRSMSFRSYWALYRMSHCHLRIAHAHCLQFERSGMVLMSHIREASTVTVNISYFHPAHQHYTDEAHKAERNIIRWPRRAMTVNTRRFFFTITLVVFFLQNYTRRFQFFFKFTLAVFFFRITRDVFFRDDAIITRDVFSMQ